MVRQKEKKTKNNKGIRRKSAAGPGELERKMLDNRLIVCFMCGSTWVRIEHCKVYCATCGQLIENCSGD